MMTIRQLACIFLLCLSAIAAPVHAIGLPSWQAMEFEQRAFWATARAHIELDPGSDADQPWHLRAVGSVVGKYEQVDLELEPETGQLISRTRLGQGKGRRFKRFQYTPDGITRVRREPGGDAATSSDTEPMRWPVSSRRTITYPQQLQGRPVTDANVLPLLAQRLLTASSTQAETVVHTEFNFYLVRMTCDDGISIPVDYQITEGERVRGQRETRAVSVHATPLGKEAEATDFNLLGLQKDIILLFDRDSGQLLQIRGKAPRIGSTRLNLKSLTLRNTGA